MEKKTNITTSNGEFKTFIGKESSAMISFSENDFTIIFQDKYLVIDSNITNVTSDEEVFLPTLICSLEDIIVQAGPNCNILYNNILNVETIITGYIIGMIYRQEDITSMQELISNKHEEIITDDKLKKSLEPLIDKSQGSDDIEFSELEDQMYLIIEEYFNNLQ